MKKRIGRAGFKAIESYLRKEANRLRLKYPLLAALIQAACLDGTDLKAWSSRNPHDNTRGLGDAEARVGRDPEGFYLGYRSLFLVDMEGFPLGHAEDSANMNEKEMVEKLLEEVLGEGFEVELVAGDSQLESRRVFKTLEQKKIKHIIPWRRLKGRMNQPDVLTVKDRIDVEGPEHKRVIYGRLRAKVESFISTLKNRLGYDNLAWKGLENAAIHTSLALSVAYAVHIVAMKMGKPDLARSIAYFA
ncbi:MAG: transposase [Candidatus Freyarchaeota archaeon]